MNLTIIKFLMLAVFAIVSHSTSPTVVMGQSVSDSKNESCKKACKKANCKKSKKTADKIKTESTNTSSTRSFRSERTETRNQRLDLIAKTIDLKPNQVVADIGAGNGIMTWRFAEAVGSGGKAIGIEVDPSSVRLMNADAQRRNLSNYEARLVLPDDPMLEANSTDVIFLKHAYHHIGDRINYFSKLKSVLKSDGRLITVDFSETSDSFSTSTEDLLTKKELTDELNQAGYKLVKEHDVLLPKDYFLEFEVADK